MSSLLVSLSLSLSLTLSFSLPSFGRKIDRQPPVPHYGLFLERRGGWEDDGGGKESGREKEGQGFSFQLSPLKGTAWEQKLARVLEGWRYTGCSTMGLFTSSQKVKRPK